MIRQSRLLDIDANEPTDDAYLLVRWIANKPVGETEYVATPDEVAPDACGDLDIMAEPLAVQA